MQVSECKENEVTYGIIHIKLKEAFTNLDTAQNIVVEFMQRLQPIFAIRHNVGITVCKETQQHKLAVTDYWQDADGADWKVKGCTDGNAIVIRYIKNFTLLRVEQEETFLNNTVFAKGHER